MTPLPVPPLHEAVATLHHALTVRIPQWKTLAHDLTRFEPDAAHQALRDVTLDLRRHLGPYIEFEEALLSEQASLDPLVELEHAALLDVGVRLEELVSAASFDVAAAQASLARLCIALDDHLRHERAAYLPVVPHTPGGTGDLLADVAAASGGVR